MDAVHHDVFSKFKPIKKLSTRQEADGKEVQVGTNKLILSIK